MFAIFPFHIAAFYAHNGVGGGVWAIILECCDAQAILKAHLS